MSMKKRTQICFYIFVICAFVALGIIGYFILKPNSDEVMVGAKKFVTFNFVPDSSSYLIEVKNEDNETASAVYTIDRNEITEDSYEVLTVVEKDGKEIAEESYIQQITKEDEIQGKINCEIKDYTVTVSLDGKSTTYEYVDQLLEDVDDDIFCVIVSEYFEDLFDKDGEYIVSCTPQDENGEPIGENKEVDFTYVAYYEQDFLRRSDFFYNGTYYDYVITSVDELEALVHYAILYRLGQEPLSFYVKTDEINSRNINNLVINSIISYPEYDALEEKNVFASMKENIGFLQNFEYYLDENFTETYLDLKDINSSAYERALQNLHKPDLSFMPGYVTMEPTQRTFAIDSLENEVLVNNTEQLLMVVQSGAKPIFAEGSEIAQTVYENAREVLREINNSDSLSDYEKALNIYRYLTSNIIYDHVVTTFMEIQRDKTVKTFGNFSCLYLEGVFYDFPGLEYQYAVCDGLAKAYSLMCNIEGIECFKVNGEIIGQGNHAWNKIYLEAEPKYNLNTDWYYVDTTWGEGAYAELDENSGVAYTYQVPVHNYFLFSQNDFERKIIYPEDTEIISPSQDYEYYKNNFVLDSENNLYINSDEDFTKTLSYVNSYVGESNEAYILEVQIDDLYKVNTKSIAYTLFYGERKDKKLVLRAYQNCKEYLIMEDIIIFKFE